MKGATTGTQEVKETYPDASHRKDRHSGAKGDVPVLILNSDLMKDAMAADLIRRDPGPGYVHLPEWLEDNVFEEMVSEIRGPKGWEKISHQSRNEAWDLLAYDSAISQFFKGDRIKTGRLPIWAENWNKNSNVLKPGQVVEEKKVSASDFRVIR